jgi:hypothetical protein
VVVHHQDFIGQDTASGRADRRAAQLRRHRIELERQIVAESAVKADIAVLAE